MNIFDIEKSSSSIRKTLSTEKSPRVRIFLISKFFKEVLSTNDISIIEVYISEYIQVFVKLINSLDITGLNPNKVDSILEVSKEIIKIEKFEVFRNDLVQGINSLELKKLHIVNVLNGNENTDIKKDEKFSFPVMEKVNGKFEATGLLESVDISIGKNSKSSKDKFSIIPSYEAIEKRLYKQILTSWEVAREKCSQDLKKLHPAHDVIIKFSEKYANYIGESLGVALTIGFIEELYKFYNPPIDVSINKTAVFTGGIDDKGYVRPVSDKVIKNKVKTVFYSCKNIFAIPKKDEIPAMEMLEELRKKYPKRKLKLVLIEDINDLFNRRDIVSIEKQSLLKRSSKVLKKRSVTITLAVILFGIILFNILKYFDPNPASIVDGDNIVKVENKYGKVLFEKKVGFQFTANTSINTKLSKRRLIDINNDGIKELLLCAENFEGLKAKNKTGRIACFSNKGKLLWDFTFYYEISTPREKFSPNYSIRAILAVTEENNKKVIYINAQNIIYYPNVIIRLDAETGKKLPGILWHSGGINNAVIGDFNEDNKQELVAAGINNGYERAVVFSINIEGLKNDTRSPSTASYSFIGYKLAEFNKYILLPKTDYNSYCQLRYNSNTGLTFNPMNEKFIIYTIEGEAPKDITGVGYYLDKHLSNPEVLIGDAFQVRRDSLVVHGKLNPPLTNTKEYENILLNQFEEWDAKTGKIVKMNK